MQLTLLSVALALAPAVSAHFTVNYPPWRADSFTTPGASQWLWPCANISTVTNRTAWPKTGGSINLKVGHQWAPTYINLGLGNNVTSFNVSLVTGFNQTGNGTFCIREAGRAALAKLNIPDGTNATIQVIQTGESGSALYNCADITFTSDASLLENSACANSTNVGGVAFVNASPSTSNSSTNTSSGASATKSGDASSLSRAPTLFIVSGAIVFGMLMA